MSKYRTKWFFAKTNYILRKSNQEENIEEQMRIER